MINIIKIIFLISISASYASESDQMYEENKAGLKTFAGVSAALGGVVHFNAITKTEHGLEQLREEESQLQRKARAINVIRNSEIANKSLTPGEVIRVNREFIANNGSSEYYVLSKVGSKQLKEKYGIVEENIRDYENSTKVRLGELDVVKEGSKKAIKTYKILRNSLLTIAGGLIVASESLSNDYVDDSQREESSEKFDLNRALNSVIKAASASGR